jgi:7-cyano-7-deazaguanine synthase
VVTLDLAPLATSALTTPGLAVPKDRDLAEIGRPGDVPVTYVPARNTVLLGLALAWAESLGARDLFLGVNVLDASGYPDCRPEFVTAFEALANVATRAGAGGQRFRVHAPLIAWSKAEIIARGLALGVDYAMTHSCYDPAADGAACGRCDACALRRKGFREAGVADPTRYAG